METNQRKSRRQELHQILKRILGTNNVYFQPPENLKIQYPCIVYDVGTGIRTPADNIKYLYKQGYSLTLITKNEDPPEVDELLELPYCQGNRPYKAENLYHWPFFIYY